MASPVLSDEGVFLFNLNHSCGGYAYFSASTIWVGSEGGKEIRQPEPDVNAERAASYIERLGQYNYVVHDVDSYDHWLLRRGWALVTRDFGRQHMAHWIGKKTCLKSSFRTYTDIGICSPRATSRKMLRRQKERIVERDNGICLLCGDLAEDIEIHHVRPYSGGGETLSSNLVVLCHDCNQRVGTDIIDSLYDLAGVPHGHDHSLLRGPKSLDAILASMQFSDNMMHSRCELW